MRTTFSETTTQRNGHFQTSCSQLVGGSKLNFNQRYSFDGAVSAQNLWFELVVCIHLSYTPLRSQLRSHLHRPVRHLLVKKAGAIEEDGLKLEERPEFALRGRLHPAPAQEHSLAKLDCNTLFLLCARSNV